MDPINKVSKKQVDQILDFCEDAQKDFEKAFERLDAIEKNELIKLEEMMKRIEVLEKTVNGK